MLKDIISFFCEMAETVETVANLAIIISVCFWIYRRMWVSITLSCGTFEVRRKVMNASNLTNLVSKHFFNGGRLPNEVREEVIELTNPTVRRVIKY